MPIQFRQLEKRFGDKHVLRGVDLEIRDGECFFVIGTSGVGKSVLIKHLVGLLRPDAGDIFLDGEEVSRLSERAFYRVRQKCAMVFQHSTLFDSMTCVENVALPLRMHRGLRLEAALSAAAELLERVYMSDFAQAMPSELGDGMRKRVAIARALALKPRYMLFDEPTTSLDPINARRIDALIQSLSQQLGVTSIVVSHDLTSIFAIAHRIAMLYQGQVRLLGTKEVFKDSTDPIVQQFISGQAQGPMEV
jgi:phospholipid/cholesterol/gamma-HCH transport system ATP-binding protein